jgi:2-polyprenylphenol 6-hydroxylase
MASLQPFDVVIAGGGPVGWACALHLSGPQNTSTKPVRVAVIDRESSEQLKPAATTDAIAKRVYTVSREALAGFAAQGVQLNLARTTEVRRILVFGRDQREALCIDEHDTRAAAIARIIEHDELTAQLAATAMSFGVTRIEAQCVGTEIAGDMRIVELSDRQLLSTQLLVVADGRASTLSEALGVEAIHRSYERQGVVAHFELHAPHRGDARQWFLPDGSILALLPLPHAACKPAASMVWSVTNERADALKAMSDTALCEAVTNATGRRAVATQVLQSAAAFPLTLSRTVNPVAGRAIVTGDAAHAIHPLAGQGVNLGFADARALAQALSGASSVGFDVGHPLLLGRYRRARYGATLAMQVATDALARIYNQGTTDHTAQDASFTATLPAFSDLGMRVLGRLPAFRRILSSAAA